jgi:uncharacterized membrane protein required for colicin V production
MNISVDILVIAVFIISVLSGLSRGFIRASKNIIMNLITIVLMICLTVPVTNVLKTFTVYSLVNDSVVNAVYNVFQEHSAAEGIQSIIYNLGLPEFITNQLILQADFLAVTEDTIALSISSELTAMILKAISSISVFIFSKFILAILSSVLDGVLDIPAIDKLDKFAGLIMGVGNALLIIYISSGLVMLFTPLGKMQSVDNFIQSTYILRYFYENNYLLNLFI